MSGVMMFVVESPTRYAAWVNSGERPSCMSIGTKIGASRAHLADAEPMSRLTVAVSRMIPKIVTCPGRAIALSRSAPLSAIRAPRFDCPNAAMKSAAKNAMTM